MDDAGWKSMLRDNNKTLKDLMALLKNVSVKQDQMSGKLQDLENKVSSFDVKLAEQGKAVQFVQEELAEVKAMNKSMSDTCNDLTQISGSQREQILNVQERTVEII